MWLKTVDGIFEPVWSHGPILPTSFLDLLAIDENKSQHNQQEVDDAEPYVEGEEIEIDDISDEEDDY